MNATRVNEFRYDIDRSDRIVRVSPNWDGFALVNGGRNICVDDILGRPLWNYITGDACRMLWRHLLAQVRETQRPVSLPYRCDGPAIRRYMEMTIQPLGHGGIKFISSIILEEKRQPVVLLDLAAPRSNEHLVVCSWCNRAKSQERWLQMDELVRRDSLFVHAPVPQLTHGICEDCALQFETATD